MRYRRASRDHTGPLLMETRLSAKGPGVCLRPSRVSQKKDQRHYGLSILLNQENPEKDTKPHQIIDNCKRLADEG